GLRSAPWTANGTVTWRVLVRTSKRYTPDSRPGEVMRKTPPRVWPPRATTSLAPTRRTVYVQRSPRGSTPNATGLPAVTGAAGGGPTDATRGFGAVVASRTDWGSTTLRPWSGRVIR